MINKPTKDFEATSFDVALAQGETGSITAKIGTGLSIPATKSYLQVDYNSTIALGSANAPETIYYATYDSGTGALTGVVRGQAGTTDVLHAAGAKVQCAMSTAFLEDNTGWKDIKGTFSYASATTINVDAGATSLYAVGDKLKITQPTLGVKYFIITTVANALLTVTGGSDYTVANEAITSPQTSKLVSGVGFPVLNWTTTAANITKTGGTESGKFWTNGRVCSFIWKFVFGAGSAVGTDPTITLPIAADTTYNFDGSVIGEGTILDSGTALYPIQIGWVTGVTYRLKLLNAAGTFLAAPGSITATAPMTWANGDTIFIKGTYII